MNWGSTYSGPMTDAGGGEMARSVHDLRNLLNVINVCAECIHDKVPRGHADLELSDLRRSVDLAMKLTRDLLQPGDEASGRRSPIDLNRVIVPFVEEFARLAGGGVRVEFHPWAGPIAVSADEAEVEGILLNLTLNAREAMPDGGVLTIATGVIDLPGVSGPRVQLQVVDTGRGMTPEVKARIFEPFFTTKDTGTGLGLNSVASTVARLGGTLSVQSQVGVGTSVTALLPMEPEPR